MVLFPFLEALEVVGRVLFLKAIERCIQPITVLRGITPLLIKLVEVHPDDIGEGLYFMCFGHHLFPLLLLSQERIGLGYPS